MRNKINRKRNKAVTIRMRNDEYNDLQNRVIESGLTQQAYILNAIKESAIVSSDEIAVYKDISKTLADLVSQVRGIGININQMAHVANGSGLLPTEEQLTKASAEVNQYRKECEEIWLLIRSLINQQNRMEQ